MLTIREFEPEDAPTVSKLIRVTMRRSNASDYPLARLDSLIEYFTPDKVRELNCGRHCLVAEVDGEVVGTAALEGTKLCTFFVHPDSQRRQIGTALLKMIERAAYESDSREITIEASLTGALFYEKNGYRRTGRVLEGAAGPQIELEKLIAVD